MSVKSFEPAFSDTFFTISLHCLTQEAVRSLRVTMTIFPDTSRLKARKIEDCINDKPPESVINCLGLSGLDAGHNRSPKPPAKITTSVIILLLHRDEPFYKNL